MNIIGHQNILNYFNNSARNNTLAHAYLFSGPESVGKTTLAKWLIAKDAELDIKTETIPIDSHPDIFWIKRPEGKKEIPIELIRNMRSALQQKPYMLDKQYVVIEQVELLSIAAVNALLKTLEEPAGEVLIILTTNRPQAVLETIRSRCQLIYFNLAKESDIEQGLINEIGTSAKKARIAARMSQGRPGIAVSLIEHPELLDQKIEQAKTFCQAMAGSISDQFALSDALFPKGKSAVVQNAQHARQALAIWETVLHDMLLMKNGVSDRITYETILKDIEQCSQQVTTHRLIALHHSIDNGRKLLKRNVNPKLVIENILLTE